MKSLNLIGQRFGKLLVLGIDENHKYNSSKKILWKCQCDCGVICYKTAESLKRPITAANTLKACSKKCGAAISLGSRFEKLIVIENIFHNNATTQCKCLCDCGNEIIVNANNLKNGTIKSCGCYKSERMSEIGKIYSGAKNLTGQRFGKLIAIEPTEKRQNRSVIWKCKCDCGNFHLASVSNLQNGSVSRCSLCKISSKGEQKIKELLKKYNIPFETEKTFETCRNPQTNSLLRFDFYVDNTYLIEFDGIQHYLTTGWQDEEQLHSTQERDAIKNAWCQNNSIPLIRIPYTELNFLTIKDLQLNSTKFLLKGKEKNDEGPYYQEKYV